MASKRPGPSGQVPSKRTKHEKTTTIKYEKLELWICSNPSCGRIFKQRGHLLSHLSQTTRGCNHFFGDYGTKKNTTKDVHENSLETSQIRTLPNVAAFHPPAIDPWDDFSQDFNQDYTELRDDANSLLAMASVNQTHSENQNSLARRFNVPFTNSQLVETSLLKLFNDADVPHYLHSMAVAPPWNVLPPTSMALDTDTCLLEGAEYHSILLSRASRRKMSRAAQAVSMSGMDAGSVTFLRGRVPRGRGRL